MTFQKRKAFTIALFTFGLFVGFIGVYLRQQEAVGYDTHGTITKVETHASDADVRDEAVAKQPYAHSLYGQQHYVRSCDYVIKLDEVPGNISDVQNMQSFQEHCFRVGDSVDVHVSAANGQAPAAQVTSTNAISTSLALLVAGSGFMLLSLFFFWALTPRALTMPEDDD